MPSDLKPYLSLNLVQPVPMTSLAATVPQPPQQEPPPIATASGKKGKACKRASKDKATLTDLAPPPPPKPCALCDVVSHTTHTCPELPHIKLMVKVAFPKSTVPETSASSSTAAKNTNIIHHRCKFIIQWCDSWIHLPRSLGLLCDSSPSTPTHIGLGVQHFPPSLSLSTSHS